MTAIVTNAYIAVQSPVAYTAVATAAETAFHLPTNAVVVVPIADNTQGMRLDKAYAITRADPGAVINCQLYKLVGTTYTLIDSNTLADVVPDATTANVKASFDVSVDDPLILHPGEGLAFAIGGAVANGVVCRVSGGSYAPLT
ncbi:hypothetical protein [Phenylobacterium sp.]|uniref:hypothetical protein n=1 Tax=Phenylobacterium sp. TaxID=1871053 RepID=UPI0026392380|nr:hypothetical protein [Phenylobacterium sp.]